MLKCLLTVSLCISTSASQERVFLGPRGEQGVMREERKVCCWSFWPCWHKFVVNRLWPNDLWVLHHGVVKENLTFRLPGCCGSCRLARHYGSVFCPEVKRHQQADVQAAVCWSLCPLILSLLSAPAAEWKLTFLKMLFIHGARIYWDRFCDAAVMQWCMMQFVMNEIRGLVALFLASEGNDLSMQEI